MPTRASTFVTASRLLGADYYAGIVPQCPQGHQHLLLHPDYWEPITMRASSHNAHKGINICYCIPTIGSRLLCGHRPTMPSRASTFVTASRLLGADYYAGIVPQCPQGHQHLLLHPDYWEPITMRASSHNALKGINICYCIQTIGSRLLCGHRPTMP